jgi:serpin B
MASFRASPLVRSPRSTRIGSGAGPWLIAACAALAAGCGVGGQTGDEHNDEGDGVLEELSGNAQRLTASGNLPNSASDDGWSFAWKFYGAEADASKNTFFSPYSISVASSMLVAGAAGQTKTEMQTALEFSNDGDAFHGARNAVAQALEARNRPSSADQNEQTLRVVNDLWLAPEFRPKPAFLDTLAAYYGASSYIAPFDTDPEAARLAINEKIATDTERLIEDLLPPSSIDESVAFVLTNALYFKARWQSEFAKSDTVSEPFETASGASVPVDMMHAEFNTSYATTDDYVAVSMPYESNQLELVAIMPTPGTFPAFVAGLNESAAGAISEALAPARIRLGFPKLSIEATVPLKARLQALGMQQAFTSGADFSALSDGSLFISDAFHQATISIDEEGTVAAAATAFVGVNTSAPPPGIPVLFDHPFVFFIRDIQTNALLFVGHYSTP